MNKTTSITFKGRKLVVDGQKKPLKQFLNIQNKIKELKHQKRNLSIEYFDLHNKIINGVNIDKTLFDSIVTKIKNIESEIDELQLGKYDKAHADKRREIIKTLGTLIEDEKTALSKSVFDQTKAMDMAKIFKKKIDVYSQLERHGITRIVSSIMTNTDISEGKTPEVKVTKTKDKKKEVKKKVVKKKDDIVLSPDTKLEIKNNIKVLLKKTYRFKDKTECISRQRSKPYYMSKDEILNHIEKNEELKKLMPSNFKKLSKEQLCEYFFSD